MKLWKTTGRVALVMAAVGMLMPNWAWAQAVEGAQQNAQAILDVSLLDGNLVGQVLDAQGAPIRGEAVSIRKDGQEVAQVKTDDLGRYNVRGLKTGLYQVVTTQGGATYRVWDAQTAPPAAQPGALMIIGQPVRGQLGGGGLLGNPWVLGGIAAAAIIIPLALDDDKPAS